MNRKLLWYIVGCMFFLLYGYIITQLTIFNRQVTEYPTYNTEIFWCLKAAWADKNARYWYCIIGNIALFIPMGFMVPSYFKMTRRVGITALIGSVISLSIEIVQLIFHIGLFEFDDIINNTAGAILGYSIYMIISYKKKHETSILDRIIVGIVWVCVVGMIVVALYNGQPVFNELHDIIITFRKL